MILLSTNNWDDPELTLSVLNSKSQQRRQGYLSKCEFTVPLGDGVNGWPDGDAREKFWNKIFVELI